MKLTKIAALVALTALTLTGCQGGGDDNDGGNGSQQVTPVKPSDVFEDSWEKAPLPTDGSDINTPMGETIKDDVDTAMDCYNPDLFISKSEIDLDAKNLSHADFTVSPNTDGEGWKVETNRYFAGDDTLSTEFLNLSSPEEGVYYVTSGSLIDTDVTYNKESDSLTEGNSSTESVNYSGDGKLYLDFTLAPKESKTSTYTAEYFDESESETQTLTFMGHEIIKFNGADHRVCHFRNKVTLNDGHTQTDTWIDQATGAPLTIAVATIDAGDDYVEKNSIKPETVTLNGKDI